MARKKSGPSPTAMVALFGAANLALVIAVYGIGGTDIENVRVALRLTARISLALFLATFIASSVNRLLGGPVGKFLLRNRRYFGVAFGVAHLIHLGTIAMRVGLHPTAFWAERSIGSLVPGASVYMLIVLMLVTSTDRTTRWIGRRNWNVLHKVGVYAIFAIFVGSYSRKDLTDPWVAIPFALLIAALALRAAARAKILTARRRKRR